MSKIMTVDILSSIKGARPSEAVTKLFEVIKNAHPTSKNTSDAVYKNAMSLNDLREDVVIESSTIEKQFIRDNFPQEKQGYLVVSKVIED